MGVNQHEKNSQGSSKSKKKNEQLQKIPFGSTRFARIELTEAEKDDFNKLWAADEFTTPPFDEWARLGYKFSATPDERGGGIICTLSPIYTSCENAGLQLSARAGNFLKACAVLEYKDRYVAGEDGWLACENRRGGNSQDIG